MGDLTEFRNALARCQEALEATDSAKPKSNIGTTLKELLETEPRALYQLLQEARHDMAHYVCITDMPLSPTDILKHLQKHMPTLIGLGISTMPCQRRLELKDDFSDVATKPTGVCWTLLCNLRPIAITPTGRWFFWEDILSNAEKCQEFDVPCKEFFRKTEASELSAATAIGCPPICIDDTRNFYAIQTLALTVHGKEVTHELVIAMGEKKFLAVLAADCTDPNCPVYLFSPKCDGQDRRDVCKEVQEGGYLTFVVYLALRSLQPNIPDFKNMCEMRLEREEIIKTTKAYVDASRRVSDTEEMVKSLRLACKTISRGDQNTTCRINSCDFFTGCVYDAQKMLGESVLSKLQSHLEALESLKLHDNAKMVLLSLVAIVREERCHRLKIQSANNFTWCTTLKDLLARGEHVLAQGFLNKLIEGATASNADPIVAMDT